MPSRRRSVPFVRCFAASWVLHGTALAAVGVLAGWMMRSPEPLGVRVTLVRPVAVPIPLEEEPVECPLPDPPPDPPLDSVGDPVVSEEVAEALLPAPTLVPVETSPPWDELERDFAPRREENEERAVEVAVLEEETELQTDAAPIEAAARVEPAVLVEGPPPRYPARSVWAGEEGTVLCRLFVGADGEVTRVELVESSGFPRLDEAALEALRRWRFRPRMEGAVALPSEILHPVTFRLEDR